MRAAIRAMTERERRALDALVTAGEDASHEFTLAAHAFRKLGAVARHIQKELRDPAKKRADPDQR